MITRDDLRAMYRPYYLPEKDRDNRKKVDNYVDSAEAYMTFLEGMFLGLQSAIKEN